MRSPADATCICRRRLFIYEEKSQDISMAGAFRIERWQGLSSPNPAMLGHILTTEGFTIGRYSDQPGAVFGTRSSENDLTHWVIQGDLEITVLGRRPYILSAGDRDFIPANTYASMRAVGDDEVIYMIGEKKPEILKKKRGRPRKNDWIGGLPVKN